MKDPKLDAQLDLGIALDKCRDAGLSVVCVVLSYPDKDNAHFSTHLTLKSIPELGVTEDHVLLDAMREITSNWSEIAHKKE